MCMVISFIHFLIMLERSVSTYETPTNSSQLAGQNLNTVGNCIKLKFVRENGMDSNSSLKEKMVTFTQLKFHLRSFYLLNSTEEEFLLNPNMLIFRGIFLRILRTSSYNLAKHYLNHLKFNFSNYLNVMTWKLKSNLPQAKKLMVLQYLTHTYAELLFQCIFQFLAFDVPLLSTCGVNSVIQVPISHFLVFKDPPRHKIFIRNKNTI